VSVLDSFGRPSAVPSTSAAAEAAAAAPGPPAATRHSFLGGRESAAGAWGSPRLPSVTRARARPLLGDAWAPARPARECVRPLASTIVRTSYYFLLVYICWC
jgi:hypothetical protein